jgi:hypothetical protein
LQGAKYIFAWDATPAFKSEFLPFVKKIVIKKIHDA